MKKCGELHSVLFDYCRENKYFKNFDLLLLRILTNGISQEKFDNNPFKGLWSLLTVLIQTGNNVDLNLITMLNSIVDYEDRCRKFIQLSLGDNRLDKQIRFLSSQTSWLQEHYRHNSFMIDETCQKMIIQLSSTMNRQEIRERYRYQFSSKRISDDLNEKEINEENDDDLMTFESELDNLLDEYDEKEEVNPEPFLLQNDGIFTIEKNCQKEMDKLNDIAKLNLTRRILLLYGHLEKEALQASRMEVDIQNENLLVLQQLIELIQSIKNRLSIQKNLRFIFENFLLNRETFLQHSNFNNSQMTLNQSGDEREPDSFHSTPLFSTSSPTSLPSLTSESASTMTMEKVKEFNRLSCHREKSSILINSMMDLIPSFSQTFHIINHHYNNYVNNGDISYQESMGLFGVEKKINLQIKNHRQFPKFLHRLMNNNHLFSINQFLINLLNHHYSYMNEDSNDSFLIHDNYLNENDENNSKISPFTTKPKSFRTFSNSSDNLSSSISSTSSSSSSSSSSLMSSMLIMRKETMSTYYERVDKSNIRGTPYWAPPRKQLILYTPLTDLSPNESMNEILKQQRMLCAGCGRQFYETITNKLYFCSYLRKYFCGCCSSFNVKRIQSTLKENIIRIYQSSNCKLASVRLKRLLENVENNWKLKQMFYASEDQLSMPLPAQILTGWNWTPQNISLHAFYSLMSLGRREAIEISDDLIRRYHISTIPKINQYRKKLHHISRYILTCTETESSMTLTNSSDIISPRKYLQSIPERFYSDDNIFTYFDLILTKSRLLVQLLEDVYRCCEQHVLKSSCHLCINRGHICEICDKRKIGLTFSRFRKYPETIIYPFHTEKVSQCLHCASFFHKNCLDRNPCPSCQRKFPLNKPK
ncbi:hypothetical protein SNEBB_003769 [Seison nebaliae]|nr:hypothetical protein SNEBB_003769 [Seison nebaliae]